MALQYCDRRSSTPTPGCAATKPSALPSDLCLFLDLRATHANSALTFYFGSLFSLPGAFAASSRAIRPRTCSASRACGASSKYVSNSEIALG